MSSADAFIPQIKAAYQEAATASKSSYDHAIKCGEFLNRAKENAKAEKHMASLAQEELARDTANYRQPLYATSEQQGRDQ
jgi:hypothetical protein